MSRQLTAAVEGFAQVLATVPGERLSDAWPTPSPNGELANGYDEVVREVPYRLLVELRLVAADIATTRPRVTLAQHILGQHHIAWREWTGALLTVTPEELDRDPGGVNGCDWTLRVIQHHLAMTESAFRAMCAYAVEQRRAGESGALISHAMVLEADDLATDVGDQAALLANYAGIHADVQAACVDLTEDDLAAEATWWEEYPIAVRWRLHRFEAHLREHTIHVEKTLGAIGHIPGEAERMARMLHRALGEVEGLLLGAPDTCVEQCDALAVFIAEATATLRGMFAM